MNQPRLQYRLATVADTERIVQLVNRAYRGESARVGWTTESDLLDGQRTDAEQIKELLRSRGALLLAEDGEALLGCVHIEARSNHRSYLGMLTVEPSAQGLGVGKTLVQKAEIHAAGIHHSDRLEMTVIAQRADLIRWYERLGFKKTTETRAFPYGDERFGVPLRDDLYFVVLEKPLRRERP